MTIFITGVNGYLGTHLARHWVNAGHNVCGADVCESMARKCAAVSSVTPFSLGQAIPDKAFDGTDVVVHLAYDRRASIETNVEGTKMVYRIAAARAVRRQIFMSSYSARPDSVSAYGRLKYELETCFLRCGQTIVRPGLVVGNGGLFRRNMDAILATPVIPLLNGGLDLLPFIAMKDFSAAMDVVLAGGQRAYNIFNPQLITMRRFVEGINRVSGHRAIRLSIPVRCALVALWLTEKVRLRVPVDVDNVRALQCNQEIIHASDLDALVDHYCSFEESVKAVLEARGKPHAGG